MAKNWIAMFNTSLRTLDALHLALAFAAVLPIFTADIQLKTSADSLGVHAFGIFQSWSWAFVRPVISSCPVYAYAVFHPAIRVLPYSFFNEKEASRFTSAWRSWNGKGISNAPSRPMPPRRCRTVWIWMVKTRLQ